MISARHCPSIQDAHFPITNSKSFANKSRLHRTHAGAVFSNTFWTRFARRKLHPGDQACMAEAKQAKDKMGSSRKQPFAFRPIWTHRKAGCASCARRREASLPRSPEIQTACPTQKGGCGCQSGGQRELEREVRPRSGQWSLEQAA